MNLFLLGSEKVAVFPRQRGLAAAVHFQDSEESPAHLISCLLSYCSGLLQQSPWAAGSVASNLIQEKLTIVLQSYRSNINGF
jgi:hypothetical protein